MKARGLWTAGLWTTVFCVWSAAAHAQSISVEPVSCVPQEDNGIVRAQVSGAASGQPARLYFRWRDHKAFYWVPMEIESGGRYWATPPKPEQRNEQIEYYVALLDAAGNPTARSESRTTKVTGDCKVKLTPKERGVAENLTVGETAPDQQGKEVFAFLCDGVVTRINSQGIRRADEVCRVCVVAWWQKKAVLLPAAVVTGVVVTEDDPEPSPSRPPARR